MPKDLQTLKLARKSRTYFFDIARSSNGLYLRMSCSEKTRTGFEHHRLFVFEEDLGAFVTALNQSYEALQRVGDSPKAKPDWRRENETDQ